MTNFPHRLCVSTQRPGVFSETQNRAARFAYKFTAIVINSEAGISFFLTSVIYIYMFKCNTMSRLCRKEMGQKHRRDSTKHVAVFLPEGTCNNKKVGLNLIFGGTLGTSSVLKRSRRNKQRKHNSFFTSPSLKLFQNRA